MALERAPVYNITFTLEDLDGNQSSFSTHALTQNTIAEMTADVDLRYLPAIRGISNAVIRRVSYTTYYEEVDEAVVAGEASDVQRKGNFNYVADNRGKVFIEVPSLNNAVVIDGTNIINVSSGAGQTFNDLMLGGGFVTRPVSYLGADINRLLRAYKGHRASSKG